MIPIHINQEHKFKTVSIVVKFKSPIDAHTLTERAVLSKLLTKVSSLYPTEQLLLNKLADMYGAHLFSYVSKQKNFHVMTIGIEIVNDKYLADKGLLDEAVQLLAEIIQRPLADNKEFHPEKVSTEIQLLQAKFDAVRDNKSQYGFQQLIKTMFEPFDYQYPSYGIEEQLPFVTAESVRQAYDAMIEKDEKHIFIIGDVDEEIKHKIEQQFTIESIKCPENQLQLPKLSEPIIINESVETTQARINIGLTIDVEFGSKEYFALILLNQIYGGDVTSLLFMNVREKLSLAYQVHSQLDARLGVMYVMAGVNAETKDLAVQTILNILEDIQAGRFEDVLIETAKTMLISHKIETFDRPRGWIESAFAQTIDQQELSADEWIAAIRAVTKEEITAAAQQLRIQTIYCLLSEVTQ